MKRQAGFTLIELMITVVIIGILTAIVVPNYSRYMLRTRLTDAYTGLAGVQPIAEQYWSNNRTYAALGTPPVGIQMPANTENFTFAVDSASATAYTISATGRNGATGFTFTIDQSGNRATTAVPTGWVTSTTCWVRDKGGQCSQ